MILMQMMLIIMTILTHQHQSKFQFQKSDTSLHIWKQMQIYCKGINCVTLRECFLQQLTINHCNDLSEKRSAGVYPKSLVDKNATRYRTYFMMIQHWDWKLLGGGEGGEHEVCIWMFLYFQVFVWIYQGWKVRACQGRWGWGRGCRRWRSCRRCTKRPAGGWTRCAFPYQFRFRIYIIMYMGNNFPSLTFLFLETMLETSFFKLLPIYYYIHIYYYYCIINYFISYAKGGQQVVEYILHLSGRKKNMFFCVVCFFRRYLTRFISFGVGR